MATIYHVTPITPKERLQSVARRAFMVSHYAPQQLLPVLAVAAFSAFDNGAFSYHLEAIRIRARIAAGKTRRGDVARLAWLEQPRDWNRYYAWLEPILFAPGRWFVIPDVIAEGSQAQDALLRENPFGHRGAPVWHTGEPIARLLRLADEYPRVCIGSTDEHWQVGGDAWLARMDEAMGELFRHHRDPCIHMLRGTAVSHLYPFHSADSSSLAQNSHRYNSPLFDDLEQHRGTVAYADRLEDPDGASRIRRPLPRDRSDTRSARVPRDRSHARSARGTPGIGLPDERGADQLGLW